MGNKIDLGKAFKIVTRVFLVATGVAGVGAAIGFFGGKALEDKKAADDYNPIDTGNEGFNEGVVEGTFSEVNTEEN